MKCRKAVTIGMAGLPEQEKVVLIATRSCKAEAIEVLADDYIDPMLPCSILKICRDVTVIIDKELEAAMR